MEVRRVLFRSSWWATHTYDEDDEPTELLQKYSIKISHPKKDEITDSEIKRLMDEEQSKSIESAESYEEAWSWFHNKSGVEICFSIKIDGNNTKNLYKRIEGTNTFKHLASRTRGRSGDSVDIYDSVSNKIPQTIELDTTDDIVWVRSEGFADEDCLQSLRDKYNMQEGFVSPRSAGVSLLRLGNKDKEDLKHLRVATFKISCCDKVSSSIDLARSLGMETTVYILRKDCPKEFSSFKIWLKEVLDEMYVLGKDAKLPSDGVVAEVNNQKLFYTMGEKNQYFGGNIALKMNQWGANNYQAILKNIQVVNRGRKFSFIGEIEPTKVCNGNTVKFVNLFNLSIIQSEGIKVGDRKSVV